MQPSLSHLETTARTPDKMKAQSRLVEHSYLSSAETQTTAPIRRDYDTRKASRPVCLAYYPARASKLVPKRQQMHESRRRQPMSCPLRSPSTVWPRSDRRAAEQPAAERASAASASAATPPTGSQRNTSTTSSEGNRETMFEEAINPQLETHSRHHAHVECI